LSFSEEAAVAIRTAYEQQGELSAAIEVRRLFPRDHRQRQGAGMRPGHRRWKPLPAAAACHITQLRLRRNRAQPTKP
jgi:hypothetical protein